MCGTEILKTVNKTLSNMVFMQVLDKLTHLKNAYLEIAFIEVVEINLAFHQSSTFFIHK
jgi:hypothetical protein